MSSFTWLDHSEEERRRILDAIDLFSQPGSLNELGLGALRDGFADVFAPGTSTIQTRLRYFLLIPWAYLTVEQQRSSRSAGVRAREAEVALIERLMESGDRRGLIGQSARRNLKRLPSGVYWEGLRRWGIRTAPVALTAYHRWIDQGTQHHAAREEDGAQTHAVWHAGLPDIADDFSEGTSLALRRDEADYLAERIQRAAPGSLLTWLINDGDKIDGVAFPWDHSKTGDMGAELQHRLLHARNFSESMHGAQLLYNLLLARARKDMSKLADEWAVELDLWQARLSEQRRQTAIDAWDVTKFWSLVGDLGVMVPRPTRSFIENWIEHVRHDLDMPVRDNAAAAGLVTEQEMKVKGGQARLRNASMLEAWGGDSGSEQLNYRWRATVNYTNEIVEARGA